MQVSFQRTSPLVPLPVYQTAGSIAFDIAVLEEKTLEASEIYLFSTGLIIQVPKGYGLILANRSSSAKKKLTLINGIGIIDQDYCGPKDELYLAVKNIGETIYKVQVGERLAQGFFIPIERVEFIEKAIDVKNSRGGFGSTG